MSRLTINFNLLQLIKFWEIYVAVNIQKSQCLPVALMQAWRRLRHWPMPSSDRHRSIALQVTHQSDAASNYSYPALLSGRLTAPDFVTNCTEVRAVGWPEMWNIIRVAFIIELAAANDAQNVRIVTAARRDDNDQQNLSEVIM